MSYLLTVQSSRFQCLFVRREDARFVYKRIPNKIKAENDDIKAAFSLLQRLWVTDYEGIWAALSYCWPDQLQDLSATLRGRLQDRILTIVQRAYSNITAKNLGRLLGMPQQEAAHCAIEKGWAVDDSGLIAPKPASGHSIWEPSDADLQKLAQYVVFLQAGEPAPTAP